MAREVELGVELRVEQASVLVLKDLFRVLEQVWMI